jgi:hypothetical protein
MPSKLATFQQKKKTTNNGYETENTLVISIPNYSFLTAMVSIMSMSDSLRSSGSGTGSTQPREYN